MIKDIIVNLEHEIARDPARDFAITVVENFGRREREAARSAIERFDALPDAAWFPPSIACSRP